VGQERISPLEALHEDLYFVTLDFFSVLLKRPGGEALSPGRILPVIHPRRRSGRETFALRLVPRSRREERIPADVSVEGLRFRKGRIEALCRISPAGGAALRTLRRHAGFSGGRAIAGLEISMPKDAAAGPPGAFLLTAKSGSKQGKRDGGNGKGPWIVPRGRPLGYTDTVQLLRGLDGRPGVAVHEEGRSFGGLVLHSIEHTWPSPSRFVSHAKRVVVKPTFFINCRHHANEVSSTGAALELSRLLLSRCRGLLRKINVVINPLENADGVEILAEMLRETPTDKLHAARYNRAGREYYEEYFRPGSPFGEARVKPAIWRRWLPDACVDNHGFPSHEWEQPFSGYAPYRFREFWIPRALLYLYLPHLEAPSTPAGRRSARLAGLLQAAFSGERRIADQNRRFAAAYRRYHLLKAGGGGDREANIPFLPFAERFHQTNYAYRVPAVTALDFITEVADETAWGSYLQTCVRAHLLVNLTVIKRLNKSRPHVRKIFLQTGKEGLLLWQRERPLSL